MPFYQLGISANPGNSGGPVFDSRGQVIGVVTLKASQEGISYCIPWQDLKERIEAIEKEDPARTASLGQSNHQMYVVLTRSYAASHLYLLYMRLIAGAMQGRSPQDGFNLWRNAIHSQFQGVDKEIINAEILRSGSQGAKRSEPAGRPSPEVHCCLEPLRRDAKLLRIVARQRRPVY